MHAHKHHFWIRLVKIHASARTKKDPFFSSNGWVGHVHARGVHEGQEHPVCVCLCRTLRWTQSWRWLWSLCWRRCCEIQIFCRRRGRPQLTYWGDADSTGGHIICQSDCICVLQLQEWYIFQNLTERWDSSPQLVFVYSPLSELKHIAFKSERSVRFN